MVYSIHMLTIYIQKKKNHITNTKLKNINKWHYYNKGQQTLQHTTNFERVITFCEKNTAVTLQIVKKKPILGPRLQWRPSLWHPSSRANLPCQPAVPTCRANLLCQPAVPTCRANLPCQPAVPTCRTNERTNGMCKKCDLWKINGLNN